MLKAKLKSTSKQFRRLVLEKLLQELICLSLLKLLSNSDDMLKSSVLLTRRSSLIHNTKRPFRSPQLLTNKSSKKFLKNGKVSSIKVVKTPNYKWTTLRPLAGKAYLPESKATLKWLQSKELLLSPMRGGISRPKAGTLNLSSTADKCRTNGSLKVNRNYSSKHL